MAFVKYDKIEQAITDEEMLDLASKFLLSIKSRNWDLLRLIITRDCVWRWPGIGPVSGMAVGIDSVIKEISGMAGRVTELKLRKVLYGLNGVALSLHFHFILSGVDSDQELVTVCMLRGYQIAGISTYVAVPNGSDLPSKNAGGKMDQNNKMT
jgi:uncharacterized protein